MNPLIGVRIPAPEQRAPRASARRFLEDPFVAVIALPPASPQFSPCPRRYVAARPAHVAARPRYVAAHAHGLLRPSRAREDDLVSPAPCCRCNGCQNEYGGGFRDAWVGTRTSSSASPERRGPLRARAVRDPGRPRSRGARAGRGGRAAHVRRGRGAGEQARAPPPGAGCEAGHGGRSLRRPEGRPDRGPARHPQGRRRVPAAGSLAAAAAARGADRRVGGAGRGDGARGGRVAAGAGGLARVPGRGGRSARRRERRAAGALREARPPGVRAVHVGLDGAPEGRRRGAQEPRGLRALGERAARAVAGAPVRARLEPRRGSGQHDAVPPALPGRDAAPPGRGADAGSPGPRGVLRGAGDRRDEDRALAPLGAALGGAPGAGGAAARDGAGRRGAELGAGAADRAALAGLPRVQPLRPDGDLRRRRRGRSRGPAARSGADRAAGPAARRRAGLRAGRGDGAVAGGCAGRGVRRRRAGGARLPGPAGSDGGALRARPVRPPRARACTGRAIARAGWWTARCSSWGASTTR